MKIDKVIVSCDDSHYQFYWPIIAKVCKKNIKATPVLFKISDEESDFYFDGNGIVKNVKALPDVSTGIQSLFYRMYATKLFPDEVCLISDIDMMLLSHDYFQGTIKDFHEDSIVVYSSDAYDKNRKDFNGFYTEDVFGMCYNAAKGKIFEEVLDLRGDFKDFIERIRTYNIEKGLEWFGDEIYLTNRVNLFSEKYQVHKLRRGYEENFKVPDRIEKWQFPVEFVIPEMVTQNSEDGNYNVDLLRDGYYKDCHCVRPYGWYEKEIHDVANISCEKNKLFETIPGENYSLVDDRCLYDDGCIVDVGCLNWDWCDFFIGKKRIIGIDPFETEKKYTELFKGVLGTFDGTTIMENRGIESTVIGQERGEEVIVKKWKTFIKEYNIDKISVLKLNIEGAEYDLLNSMDDTDFNKIDQIAVSFHDWMVPDWKEKTDQCISLLKSKNYEMIKINENWGWFLFKKIQKNMKNKKNIKKIVLISSYCDTKEKIEILTENIKTLKSLGLDTLVISPITLPNEVIELSDFVFFTKENPLLNWPDRGFTFWQTHYSSDGWMTMHRNVADYGWAGLYQIKKMSQIALSYDYDYFYHIIYDLEIDEYVVDTIKSDVVNLIHPRINPNKNNDWWDCTLHFMIFNREIMNKIVNVIKLEDYLNWDGVAEGQALLWTQWFNIEISKTPVRDKIYYWGDRGFFDYSMNSNYKLFIGKTNRTTYWVKDGENDIEKPLSSNLKFYLYDLNKPQKVTFNIDGVLYEREIKNSKIVEFELDSKYIKTIKLIDEDGEYDYTTIFKEINRNLIYLGN